MPSPTAVRPIEGSERRPAPGARRVAAENPSAKLSVTIRVRRRTDAPSLPVHHNADTPTGHVSREEFAERFGASQADLDLVVAFARAKGLEVEETSTARRVVKIFGTVEQMNHAFGVDLGRYESPTETYRGREGAVNMPQDVSNVVEGVFGLDNRRMARRAGTRVAPRPPKAFGTDERRASKRSRCPPTSGRRSTSRRSRHRRSRRFTTIRSRRRAGGQTIGLIEFGGGFAQSDLNQFFTGLGDESHRADANRRRDGRRHEQSRRRHECRRRSDARHLRRVVGRVQRRRRGLLRSVDRAGMSWRRHHERRARRDKQPVGVLDQLGMARVRGDQRFRRGRSRRSTP